MIVKILAIHHLALDLRQWNHVSKHHRQNILFISLRLHPPKTSNLYQLDSLIICRSVIARLLIMCEKLFLFSPRHASPVIVPTLPDFSRQRIGHKQYQSKYHHDRHFGPFFEDPLNTSGTFQVGFHQGTEAILNCRVGMLKDKTVIILKNDGSRV